ncbi:hypothetical protein MKJ01_12470 [Chryseobacterium sp. SSA4.19]|uniref:hypothetical protein n=1 Tax=Chryseobacterium sp. SSA4.19 TaxID=2919915 RepID=UPI001F4D6F4C|nr:hypothetical protein [Chryseobacterium sp. SSA4.19]MCJ8154579.1 hypothetical protein [Chryseobacterium sp. SSA4.19]
MATQTCPKCREDTFTWHQMDEDSDLLSWGCYQCGYSAEENEKDESVCSQCGKKAKSRLRDDKVVYWWCFSCKSEIIEN